MICMFCCFLSEAGQPVDGPQYGPPPAPWDILCNPTAMFCDEKRLVEVPHTSEVVVSNVVIVVHLHRIMHRIVFLQGSLACIFWFYYHNR